MARSLAHELYEGQAILAPVAWADFATTPLENRLKDITLGIRQTVADLPPEHRLGAVVADVRRFSAAPA
eukprot:12947436-Alexandrium_andersonii.AAC.1